MKFLLRVVHSIHFIQVFLLLLLVGGALLLELGVEVVAGNSSGDVEAVPGFR